MEKSEFIKFIKTLAQQSAELIRPWYFNPKLQVDAKSDDSPVTIADRRAEELMREMIGKTYPGHGIIGEEYGAQNENAEFVWVLDPIDGTKSFAAGNPLFGTLICLLKEGQPILGAIHLPILNQLCIGDGQQTTLNNQPVHMRQTTKLSEAILLTTDLLNIEKHQTYAGFDRLMRRTKFMRTWGDCYGYVLLASGWADIMLDPIMNSWDLLALIPVIRGAGGKITDWQGNKPVRGNSIVAANTLLHAKIIEMLN